MKCRWWAGASDLLFSLLLLMGWVFYIINYNWKNNDNTSYLLIMYEINITINLYSEICGHEINGG
jgi:hypothetical protein